jgi:Uma2 family endonuclease
LNQGIYLVIEVADSSLRRDRNVKLPAYGRAGVPETWVVDLEGEQVIVGAGPGPGGYGSVTARGRGGQLVVPAFPDVAPSVDDLFGPAERQEGEPQARS